jgi:DDE family transposase
LRTEALLKEPHVLSKQWHNKHLDSYGGSTMILRPPTPSLQLEVHSSRQVAVTFDGERLVSDTGLLAVRALDQSLGVLADLAARLPDPRSPKYIQHSVEAILLQEVYQILAGYPDLHDADHLRDDPLFQILADVVPDPEHPLASGSTLARFQYAYTRRQAAFPPEERPVLGEIDRAQTQRLRLLNDYLVALFIRTRRQPPTEIILDVDATDDPVHGQQTLSAYHGYFRQRQYFPLLVYDGATGFPLAAWLRPGTVHASGGAADILTPIVACLRAAWPGVRLTIRGDSGLAVPEMYTFCEGHDVRYVFGFGANEVLKQATAQALADVELYYHFYGRREPHVQRFEEISGYQAGTWPHPRRIVAKIEHTPQGSQRRFVVTDRQETPAVVYREWYVVRGAVPEQPIGEIKNGLQADRLSACGFRAHAFRLLVHTVAYALVVLFREAAAAVPEVATASVSTLRQRLWKVGAVVRVSARRVWLRVSATWPGRGLWLRMQEAVRRFVAQVRAGGGAACTSPVG